MQVSSETSIGLVDFKDGMDNQMWMGDFILMNKAFPGKVFTNVIAQLSTISTNLTNSYFIIRYWIAKPGTKFS